MSIKANYEGSKIISLIIDDEEYDAEADHFIIPISVLRKQDIGDLPKRCVVEICDNMDGNTIMCHNIPTTFEIMEDGKIKIIFDDTTTRKYWDGPIGLKLVMETKRDIILEMDTLQLEDTKNSTKAKRKVYQRGGILFLACFRKREPARAPVKRKYELCTICTAATQSARLKTLEKGGSF